MEEKAEAIRCIRYQSLINEQFGFLDKAKQKMDFLAYFEKKAKSKYDKWMSVYLHFKKFCGGSCTFGDVTTSLCEDFREYLLYAHNIRHPAKKIPLANNTASGYWSTFRCLLKMAYKEKYITENVNDFLEGIKWQEVKKEYQTLDEMKVLDATDCEVPVLNEHQCSDYLQACVSVTCCNCAGKISSVVQMADTAFDFALRKPIQKPPSRLATKRSNTAASVEKD